MGLTVSATMIFMASVLGPYCSQNDQHTTVVSRVLFSLSFEVPCMLDHSGGFLDESMIYIYLLNICILV